MQKLADTNLSCCFDEVTFNDICSIESIVKFTKEFCLEKEINSIYYNLSDFEQLHLSEERNHYINMLSLAEEKILKIKKTYSII